MTRDPGLQPERTAMSWIRTQLLMFGAGLLLFKIGESNEQYLVAGLGIFCICIAAASTLYLKQRFTKLFSNETAVSRWEFEVKQWLSALLALMAFGYLLSMWLR